MSVFRTISLISTMLFSSVFASNTMGDNIFVYFEGVQGDVAEPGFTNRIDILAFSWGLNKPVDISGGGTNIGTVNRTEVSLTKYIDRASAGLATSFLGTSPSDVVLSVVEASNSVEYMRIELCDAYVSSISSGGAQGEDILTENVTVSFKAFKLTYFEPNGKSGGTGDSVRWDFSTNTPGSCSVNPA